MGTLSSHTIPRHADPILKETEQTKAQKTLPGQLFRVKPWADRLRGFDSSTTLFIVHRDAFRVILSRNKVNSIYKARKYPGSNFLPNVLDPQAQNAIFLPDVAFSF